MKVTSYRQLTEEQARAAVAISGAHHSSWNGRQRQVVPEPNRKVRGVAGWDHSISYNEESVTEPAREMFRNARVYNQDPATLTSYREAVKTLLHENVHMLATEGADHSQAQNEFTRPGVRPLEEGITELYSQQKLNDYIDELGLEEIAPGLKAAYAKKAYPEFLPAAERFAEDIGRESKLGTAEVVQRMAVVTADQKFRVAAETIYDTSKLPGVVPSDQREAAVRRIESAMKPAFGEVSKLSKSDDQLRRKSAKVGARAADAGYREVAAIQQQWTQPAPEMQRSPRSQESQQTRSTDPSTAQETTSPRPTAAQETTGPGPSAAQEPSASAAPENRSTESGAAPEPVARVGELQDAVRAGLGGSAPLAGASRLGEGEQGSRHSGTQPTQQRQGPEREA